MVIALYISYLLILSMGIYIFSIKKKTQLHWAFLVNVLCMVVWGMGFILDRIFSDFLGYTSMIFTYLVYLGTTFFPVALWFIGMVFKNSNVEFSRKYILVLVIPIISNIVLWTNTYTHLFYKTFYSLESAYNIYGPYLYFVHVPYSYMLTLFWITNMIVYAIKNGGVLVKQVTIVVLATILALPINILFMLKILSSAYWNPIAYSFMLLCYLIAMIKYGFLNVIPIAKEKIVNSIRDCFVILNKNFEVQDLNKPFIQTFNSLLPIKQGENFLDIIEQYKFMVISPEYIKEAIEKSMSSKPLLPLEIHVVKCEFDKWFSVTAACIDSNKNIGSIITFRDITHEKQYEEIAIERIKLRGFVQVAGDMAHDINTPLSTARNCACEINNILNDKDSSTEEVIQKIDYLKYMACLGLKDCERSLKIANKLKNQTYNIFNEERKEFDLKTLIKNLLRDEVELEALIKQLNCKCSIDGDTNIKIQGYPTNLGKVIKNLIKNAMESYKDNPTQNRAVKVTLTKKDELVIIGIKDYGVGIKKSLQKDIFEKPLKIKNLKVDGGGLSLFFAQIIVTGQLEGKIWFESIEEEGTTFYISIPIKCRKRKKESLLE